MSHHVFTCVWDDTLCAIELARYPGTGQLAMRLISAIDDPAHGLFVGTPMGHVSYPDAQITLARDEILIKDYSEYDGMPDVLVRHGLAERTAKMSAQFGIPVLRLLIPVPDLPT